MIDRLTAENASENLLLFRVPLSRDQSQNRFAEYPSGLVPKDALRALFPIRDDPFHSLSHNRVVRRLDDGRQSHRIRFSLLSFGKIVQAIDRPENLAPLISDDLRSRYDVPTLAIGPFDDHFQFLLL